MISKPLMKLKELVKPHIDAYNAFLQNIPVIISRLPSVTFTLENKKVEVIFEDLEVSRCSKKLWECRESLSSYTGKMILTMRVFIDDKLAYRDKKNVGYLPIIANSALSENDEIGGFFLVNGIEKMIRFLIVQRRNHPLAVNRKTFIRKGSLFTAHSVLIRSVGPDEVGQMNSLHYCKDGNIILRFFLRRIEYHVPVLLILRLLKETTDEEIYTKTGRTQLLQSPYPFARAECAHYVASKFREVTRCEGDECIEKVLEMICPHLESNAEKFEFLCLSIRKLYTLVEDGIEDDVDSMMNQEAYTELQLFSSILKERLIAGLGLVRLAKSIEHIKKLEFSIGSKFEYFVSTGSLSLNIASDIMQEAGLCIHAERINLLRFVSHFRSVSRGSFFQTVKITSVRKLRPESFGFLCPVHTPDGAPCGLLTHLTLQASVTTDYVDLNIFQFGLLDEYRPEYVPVLLNGKILGYTHEPETLASTLRNFRRDSGLIFEVAHIPLDSILFPGLYIFSHPGRFVRPVARDGKREFIGPMEQIFLEITLPEIDKKEGLSSIIKDNCSNINRKGYSEIANNNLSLVASLIPYSRHNQSPRNMYQCQMAKQAMSIPSIKFNWRTDNKMYVLNSGQTPIVHTWAQTAYDLHKIPTGINCIVAVLSYTAYDMEDAMVINRSSIDRGFFGADIYQTVVLEGKISQLVPVGTFLSKNDVLCYCENSPILSDGGTVDRIRVCDGKIIVTMRIRRDPAIGDKFCSRHGQKGVCSAQWAQTDMPFTEDGIVPDIIINPHAFPSRMTIGMMIESVMGKAACLQGKKLESCEAPGQYDNIENKNCDKENFSSIATKRSYQNEEFQRRMSDPNTREVYKYLEACGYDYHGNEVMYSGTTGRRLKSDIFIGVVFYQRLRHMVNDKFQVRATGPIQIQTRQPIGGRKKHGGIRLGEMERDALIAHGCAYVLQDRLQNCSDMTIFRFCSLCQSILFCRKKQCLCGNAELREIRLPYVFKYLCSELLAMNVRVRIDLEQNKKY